MIKGVTVFYTWMTNIIGGCMNLHEATDTISIDQDIRKAHVKQCD